MTRQSSIFRNFIHLLFIALTVDFADYLGKIKSQKRVAISAFLIFLFSLISHGLYAKTYYISTVGSDVTGNGTITTPWRSLYKACTIVTKSGDIIHIGQGSFTESAYCPLSLGVSLEGEGVAKTTIISHYSASSSYGILDLTSPLQGTNGNQLISGISFSGDNLTGRVAITINRRSNVIIHDCNFTNFNDMAIYLYGQSSFTVEPTTYSAGNQVYNCIINNCSLYGGGWGRGAISFGGQSGLIIHDNTIIQTQRASGSNGYCLKGSMGGYNKGMKIYNNTMTVAPYNGTQYSFTMEFWHSQGGIEVYNNVLKGNVDFGGFGSFKGSYDYSVYFHDNICGWDSHQANSNKALQFESSTQNAIVENNIFKNVTTGVYLTFGDVAGSYSDTLIIGKNVFIENYIPISISGANYVPVISNTYIYNNMFYSIIYGDVAIDLFNSNQAAISNINIKNNIIQGFPNSPIRCSAKTGGYGSITGIYIQNNNMLSNGNSNLPRYVNIAPTTTTTSGNINSSPLFVVAGSDFHLQSGSPCIDAGIDVGLPYTDSNPDIGAFEYSGSGSNQTPHISNQSFQENENSSNETAIGTVLANDPDAGQKLSYSILSGNTSGAFAINSLTGVISVTNSAVLNFEATPTFPLIIKIQDDGTPSLSSQATVTISLIDINEAPVITNQSLSVSENSSNGTTIGTVIATDPDAGQSKTFSIVSDNTNGAFAINSSNGLLTVANSAALNFEVTPTFALVVKVQDNGNPVMNSQATITISLVDVNEAPVITNQSFSVAENSTNGTLVGTVVASDPDGGQTKTFSIISGNTGGAFAINASTGLLSVANSTFLNYESITSFALVIKVQDNGVGNLSSQATITVSVTDINEAPVIVNQSFSLAENSINGTNVGTVIASDPDAGQTIAISIISGNTNGAFVINSSTGVLTVANSAALNFENSPFFTLVIKAQDNGSGNLSSQASITISLIDLNETPVINNQSFSIAENSSNGTIVGTVVTSDPDAGQTKTFTIVSGNTNGAFAINSSTGVLTVANTAALDFEATLSFALAVKVQDNGSPVMSSQATVTISLIDVNETPVISNQSFTIAENSSNGTTVGTVVASDPDAGQTKTFTIVSGNTSGAFAINASTGIITVASSAVLNFEVTPSFALVVKVQDNGSPTMSSQATVTISLTDVNEAPVINNQSFMIPENSSNGKTIGTVVASDPDAGQTKTFSISSGNINGAFAINATTGVIRVANTTALDFETTPSFALVVKVQDNGSPIMSSQATVTISLTDVNEAPVINNQSFTIAENSANGTTVGVIAASDPDAGQTKTSAIVSGNTNNTFAINSTTGVLSVANSAILDFESTPTFALIIRVQDNGSGNLNSQATITVTITDINEAPIIANQSFSIAENSANGTNVGAVIASDPDVGQTKTFSIISGNTNGAFAINTSTGVLSVANNAALNYEVTPSFALTIKVQDNGIGNLSSQAMVTISLSDINEVPIISNQSFSVAENSANGTTIGSVVASDPDADQTKTFSIISGNTNGAFAINTATGTLVVANSTAINFESTTTFSLVVKVQDNGIGSLSSLATITISITDVNESPVIANQSFLIAENSANGTTVGTIIASDPDAGQTLSYSILSGNTNGAFAIQASTGVLSIANSTAINFESTPSFSLVIKVIDNGTGALSSQAVITVTIADINELPVIVNQSFSVAENSANGITVGTVIASDPDAGQTKTFSIISGNTNGAFTINASTGVLTVSNSSELNFENTTSFTLGVKVQDNGVGNLSSQAIITIWLTDINEAPQISNQSFSIDENSANGTTIGIVVASDPDAAQTKTFSIISGNTNGGFIINSITGILTVANSAALNFESTPTFILVIKVQDNGGLSSQANVTVSLNDVNEVPLINNQNFNVQEFSSNGTSVGFIYATDPDASQSLSYQITSGNTGNAFSINVLTGELKVLNSSILDFSVNPTFELSIKIIDNGIGNLSNNAIININISQSPNQAPVINNQFFSIAENSANSTSVGTVIATDPDAGQTKTFTILSGNTNGTFAINAATGVLTVANSTALDFENAPSFALIIKVQDNGVGNLSSQATITVYLTDINEVPIIANQSFSVNENSPNGTLVGTIAASDPDAGQTKTFSIVSGNTGGAFTLNASTGILTVANSTALDFENAPSFALIIKVQDNGTGNLSSQATITVSLNDINEAPIMTDQSFTVNENSANGTQVGTVVAVDPDAGQTTTFSIISGNTGGAFAINSTTGILTVANSSILDFEAISSFAIVIKVQDNGNGNLSSTATITVSVADVNEAPVINSQSFSLSENSPNGTIAGIVIASDPDADQTKTFTILSGNTNGAFAISAVTGVLTVANSTALNFENTPSFELIIKVQDNGAGNLSSQTTITVSLTDINKVPVITNQLFTVNENSPNGTFVGAVVASDPDAGQTLTFSIVSGNTEGAFTLNTSTGILTVANFTELNFEIRSLFTLIIKVQDNGTGNLSSQATITVSLNDINETPILLDQSFTVNENSANGTQVGPVVAVDPDAGQTKSFSIVSGNTGGAFAINSTTGILTVANSSILDFEAISSFAIVIKVQDNGNGNLSSHATITVSLADANEAPAINSQSFSLSENSPNGTIAGTVIASDPDAGQTKTFIILSGNTNSTFAINAATGVLNVTNSAALDFETTPSISLVIKVQDNGGGNLSNQATITISISDVNEAPVILNQSFSILENSVNGAIVETVIASDPDAAQTKTFAIVSGNTNNAFVINAVTGTITVANSNALNFENISSFALIIKVQDNGTGNLSSQATITISISDVNEAPVILNQSFSVVENSANGTIVGTVVTSDPDNGQTKIFSIISGNTNGAFSINSSSGIITVANTNVLNFQVSPSFTLIIKVQDNGFGNLSSQATITITLADVNQAPVITDQSFSIAENSSNGNIVGTILATDPDSGQTKTFSIVSGNTNGVFAINDLTGVLKVANSAILDFETTTSFVLVIKVQDNGVGNLSSQANITISITDINEEPVVANQSFIVAEKSSIGKVVGTVLASDPDAGQSLTFSVVSGNNNGAFAINPSTGLITVANTDALIYLISPTYTLLIKVQDNGTGSLSSQTTITISLSDINEAPAIFDQSFSVAENSQAGTIVGTVIATDPDANQSINFSIISGKPNGIFAIDASSGELTVSNLLSLDFESTPSFNLIIKVQDNGAGSLNSQATITVRLTDINETPVVPTQSFSIAENAVTGTVVGTIKVSEPDADQSHFYFILSGNMSKAFSLDALTGEITVYRTTALTEGLNSPFILGVLVFDNGIGNLYNTGVVTVNVTSGQNQPPVISDQTLSVNQVSPSGTSVGMVEASSPNAEQSLTYFILSGNKNGAFDINSSTGELVVANSTALGSELSPSIDLVIKVQDNSEDNLSNQANLTILILRPDMPPVILNQTKSTYEHQPVGTVVGYVSAFNPNSKSSLKYNIISGNTGNGFSMDSTCGCITINNPRVVCFEARPVYKLIVNVENNNGLNGEATITINVKDINEAPVCKNQIFSIAENSPSQTIVGSIIARDYDFDQTLTYAIISGNDNNAFSLSHANGILTVNNTAALDFEATSTFDLIVAVEDNGQGNLVTFSTITIGLLDVNEAPIMQNQALSVIENAPIGSIVGFLKAEDPDQGQVVKFKIIGGNDSHTFNLNDSTGLLTVSDPLKLAHAKNPLFALSVIAQDNSADSLSTLSVITINIVPDSTQNAMGGAELATVPNDFNENDISIYPNPTADIVNINLEKAENQIVGIRVFSINGSEIYSTVTKGEKKVVINMENEKAGTYIAVLTLNGKIYTRNIVVKN